MRTKALIIAITALAIGVLSSQAQVYSQNIVGYINQTFTATPAFTLCAVPLQAADTSLDGLLANTAQMFDLVYVWNGYGFDYYTYLPATGPGTPPQDWQDENGNWSLHGPTLQVGTAFFYENAYGVNETNTYVGTVILTNLVTLPATPAFSLVGSTPPIADTLSGTNLNLTSALNMFDIVYVWNGYGFDNYTYLPATGPGTPPENWQDENGNWSLNGPTIGIANGFFYENAYGVNEPWSQVFVVH